MSFNHVTFCLSVFLVSGEVTWVIPFSYYKGRIDASVDAGCFGQNAGPGKLLKYASVFLWKKLPVVRVRDDNTYGLYCGISARFHKLLLLTAYAFSHFSQILGPKKLGLRCCSTFNTFPLVQRCLLTSWNANQLLEPASETVNRLWWRKQRYNKCLYRYLYLCNTQLQCTMINMGAAYRLFISGRKAASCYISIMDTPVSQQHSIATFPISRIWSLILRMLPYYYIHSLTGEMVMWY